MAKAIKRVGIIFLALAIICLLAVGVLIGVSSSKNNNIGADNGLNTDSINTTPVTELPVAGTKELNGTTCAAQATIWEQVVTLAKANPTKVVKVKMTKHWIADAHAEYVTSFGTSTTAFQHGAIYVPANTNIIIDLNGCTINRKMTAPTNTGQAIFVNGNLTIEDNSYDEQDLLDKYEFEKENDVEFIISRIKQQFSTMGKITGGAGSQTGGAFIVTSGGKLTFNSGMIADNINAPTGGAIHADSNSVININGGIIMNNKATRSNGGAIQILNESKLNINGGIILGNTAASFGGGIYADSSDIEIRNVILHGNNTGTGGGAIYIRGGNIDFYDGIILKNVSDTDAGGIQICPILGTEGEITRFGNINMYGGTITQNTAGYGTGIYLYRGATGLFEGGEISSNIARGHSAGLFVFVNASAVINNINIIKNEIRRTTTNNNDAGGAGIGIGDNSTLTINGGLIADNKIVSNSYVLPQCGGGISVIQAGFRNPSIINLNGGEITRNYSLDFAGGIYDYEGRAEINIKGDAKVYGNFANEKSSDIYLKATNEFNVVGSLTKFDNPLLGIELSEDYGNNAFTNGFGTTNIDGTNNPKDYFFSNNGAKIATLKNGEAIFENTLVSDKYDFVYYEDNCRKNYKDNDLKHAINDFAKSKTVNEGKLILGNIESNTTINDFVTNINFESENLKIYNVKGQCVYDKGIGNANAMVGTGWKVETYNTTDVLIETFYLSVLGDLTGDGNVNTLDVTYLRRIALGNVVFDNLSVEVKLACLITNKGGVITADADIIWNSIGGGDLSLYF